MNTLEAIAQRRSIRKFKDTPISDDLIEKILVAATQAPSGKNRQPWRFVVVRGAKRDEMIQVMQKGIEDFEKNVDSNTGSAKWTLKVMAQAPATVFVFNADGKHPFTEHTADDCFDDLVNVQSIGAAIQNMCLAALDLGLGSLWICDVFYPYGELCRWLGQDVQMVAAVSFGYPDESPAARPRKPLSEVVRWL